MTNQQIANRLEELISQERKITHEILLLIRESEARRLYLEKGYSSLFDWLVAGFGYSSSAAYRRIMAARALKALPDAEAKIVSGKVNLTTLSQVQATLQKEEKRLGQKISLEAKTDLLLQIEGKSSDETQKILVQIFPENIVREESLRWLNSDETKLSVILDEQTLSLLKEAKDLLSHSLPNASWAEVIGVLAENFVSKKKGLRKEEPRQILKQEMATVAAVNKNLLEEQSVPQKAEVSSLRKTKAQIKCKPITAGAVSLSSKRKLVFQLANYRCEFRDHQANKRCESTFQLQLDHIQPKALGGSDEIQNLRCLCRQHNFSMAEKNLGSRKMREYRRSWD